MDSQNWESFLHWSFLGEHVLLENLQLQSFGSFLVGSFLTCTLCLTERLLTFALSKYWNPFPSIRSSKWRNAFWRSGLYWVVTFIRLLYMLIAMSYHIGLIMVAVTALAAGQFIIELFDTQHNPSLEDYLKVPLLNVDASRNSSRSNLDGILIHPNSSTLAQADAAAMEIGYLGDTKSHSSPSDHQSREGQKGKDTVRGTNGRRHSQQQFRVGDADDNDSD